MSWVSLVVRADSLMTVCEIRATSYIVSVTTLACGTTALQGSRLRQCLVFLSSIEEILDSGHRCRPASFQDGRLLRLSLRFRVMVSRPALVGTQRGLVS